MRRFKFVQILVFFLFQIASAVLSENVYACVHIYVFEYLQSFRVVATGKSLGDRRACDYLIAYKTK